MLYWPKPVAERDSFPAPRLEYLSETARFRRSRRTADQARGCDCGLPVDDGFAIGGVGDHRHEGAAVRIFGDEHRRSEEHTSELQSLMRISYAVFCLKKTNNKPPTVMSKDI